jgi:hypothetical protein
MFQIEVKASDLPRLRQQLKKVGAAPALNKRLTKGLRDGTKPAVARTRAAALALPAHGSKSTGLRRRLAASTGTQVRTGGRNPTVSVRVSRKRMGTQAGLASTTNDGQWRHPVFSKPGLPREWVTQHSVPHWFDNANKYSGPPVRRALQGVLNQIEKDMSHS